MSQEVLRKLQQTELEILLAVDSFCKEHQIQYSLYSGTALGAVRHGGFIPWDDDIDIVMIRSEYDRFCTLWREHKPEKYELENIESNPDLDINHSKIFKMNTTYIPEHRNLLGRGTGIWIDVFVWDKLELNRWKRIPFYFQTAKLFLCTRASGKYEIESAKKRVVRKIIRIIPVSIRYKMQLNSIRWLRKHDQKLRDQFCWTSTSSFGGWGLKMPEGYPDSYEIMTFEHQQFSVFKDIDLYLRAAYGDYMKLPPQSERTWTHPPVFIDFEHNYEELAP